MLHRHVIPSPLGDLVVLADDAVRMIDFFDRRDIEAATARVAGTQPISDDFTQLLQTVCDEMSNYFAGASSEFSFPVSPVGTPFQLAVWAKLREIGPGETWTYGRQAKALGNGAAVRAVARANGQNFCSIVIPCHRVIGSDGTLTGYGGGLARKQWLLDHERRFFGAGDELFAMPNDRSGAIGR